MLAAHHLDLIGGWWSTNLLIQSAKDEIAALQFHLALLKAMGSSVFIAAECSNAIHGDRAPPAVRGPPCSPRRATGRAFGEQLRARWRAYIEGPGA